MAAGYFGTGVFPRRLPRSLALLHRLHISSNDRGQLLLLHLLLQPESMIKNLKEIGELDVFQLRVTNFLKLQAAAACPASNILKL